MFLGFVSLEGYSFLFEPYSFSKNEYPAFVLFVAIFA